MQKEYKVYVLRDVQTEKIVYAGLTRMTLQRRFNSHKVRFKDKPKFQIELVTDFLSREEAVELEKSAAHLNTRGLARALTGNLTGAIEDFEAAINSGELNGEKLEKRKRWLEVLKSGINPFTPEELEALRASEGTTP